MKSNWILIAFSCLAIHPFQRSDRLFRIEVIDSDIESVEFTLTYLIRDEVITVDKLGTKEYFSMKKGIPLQFKIYQKDFEYDKMKVYLFTEKGSMSELEIYRPYAKKELTELHPKMLLEYRFETDESIEVKNLPDRYICWEDAMEESLKYRGFIEPNTEFSILLYEDREMEINAELVVFLSKGTYTHVDYDSELNGYAFPLSVDRRGWRILLQTDLLYYQIGTFQMGFSLKDGYCPADGIWIPSNYLKKKCEFMLRLYLGNQTVLIRKTMYFSSVSTLIETGSSEPLDSYSGERIIL